MRVRLVKTDPLRRGFIVARAVLARHGQWHARVLGDSLAGQATRAPLRQVCIGVAGAFLPEKSEKTGGVAAPRPADGRPGCSSRLTVVISLWHLCLWPQRPEWRPSGAPFWHPGQAVFGRHRGLCGKSGQERVYIGRAGRLASSQSGSPYTPTPGH